MMLRRLFPGVARSAAARRAASAGVDPFRHVVADLQIVPMGVGASVSEYVVECEKVLRRHNLNNRLHAYGTNVDGDWESIMAALKECHQVLHAMGAPRVITSVKIGTRTDKEASIDQKLHSVTSKLQQ
eukprot:EG_transcript_48747